MLNINDITTPSEKFENRLRVLLKELGFTKVKGGNDFIIGDNQIDACGVCEDKLVIIECTTQRKALRSKMEVWKGKQSSIKRGLDQLSDYRNYNNNADLRFILASRYSTIDQYGDIAQEGPHKVITWGPRLIDYYEKIAKSVPFRAKYDVLADLGFEINEKEVISTPALKTIYKNIEMYTFLITPDELIKISYVARRETGRKDFYQRMIDPPRLKKIADFLNDGGIFPTNIVIGINGKYEFRKINVSNQINISIPDWLSLGVLTFPKSYQSCWIIDGQHRLFSFQKGMAQKLSVLAFGNIDLNKQTRFFLEVNKEAKPISSMLIWDLIGDLAPQSEDGIISNAVKQANTKLPFQGKISIPSLGSGKISLATFCDSLSKSDFGIREIRTGKRKTFVKNPFFNNDHTVFSKNIADSLSFYFGSINNLIGDKKDYIRDFVFDNGGVSVLIYLYKILICLEGKKAEKRIIAKYIEPIVNYLSLQGKSAIDEYKKRCSSESGKQLVLNDLLKLLQYENPEITDYIGEITDLLDELIDFESKLRNVVEVEFKRRKFADIKKHINPKIINEVEKNTKRTTSDEVSDFCGQLTLGQLSMIITRELWNKIFRNVFVRPEGLVAEMNDLRAPNEDWFKINLNLAVYIRNNLVHEKGYIPTRKDKENLHAFIVQTKSVIAMYYKI